MEASVTKPENQSSVENRRENRLLAFGSKASSCCLREILRLSTILCLCKVFNWLRGNLFYPGVGS